MVKPAPWTTECQQQVDVFKFWQATAPAIFALDELAGNIRETDSDSWILLQMKWI